MFRRLLVEDWQNTLAMISFAIFFVVFVVTAIRVWRTPSRRIEHLENLPLANDTHEQTKP